MPKKTNAKKKIPDSITTVIEKKKSSKMRKLFLNDPTKLTTPELIQRPLEKIISTGRAISKDLPRGGGHNSVQRTRDGQLVKMTISKRNFVNDYTFDNLEEKNDAFKIAVFSQEAFRTRFTRSYHKIITEEAEVDYVVPINDEALNTEDSVELVKNVNYYPKVENYLDAFVNLFKNKESPHVIAVIEGEQESLEPLFNIHEGNRTYSYILAKDSSYYGKNARQHMHFYVRKDMEKAVSFKPVEIKKTNGSKFTVMAAQFETKKIHKEDESVGKYSMLVTHILNEHVRNEKDSELTHEAFVRYASKERDRGHHVIGYAGDTNYKFEANGLQSFSIPSVGGNKQGGGHLMARSSPHRKKITHYMQSFTLGLPSSPFLMAQPSMLNVLNLSIAKSRAGTDHHSSQTTIVLPREILNRDKHLILDRQPAEVKKYEYESTPTLINPIPFESDSDSEEIEIELFSDTESEIEPNFDTKLTKAHQTTLIKL